MNLKNRFVSKNEKMQLMYNEPNLTDNMCQRIISWIPSAPHEFVIVCIGTDRSTGDALGPLTGSYLSEKNLNYLSIYGTLSEPIHAKNMTAYITQIRSQHRKPFIIAVDASLGKINSVGTIISDIGSLKPGAALNKKLPAIGDIHITGVVNISGFMEYAILQNTRLSIVVDMAKCIAAILEKVDQQLSTVKPYPAILTATFDQKKKEID